MTQAAVEMSGTETLGRYALCCELAVGGMASVHLATSGSDAGNFSKLVAVKQIHRHLARDKHFVDMFLDEARIAARIHHPNVCDVFDFGEVHGTYYIAMEYLMGETFRSIRRALARQRNGPWVGCVIEMFAQASEGLHAAHELRGDDGGPLNLVHRDISPQNLFLTYSGCAKVVDFGIARCAGRVHHTDPGTIKGKLGYMAPEQVRGRQLDRRADVWALGVTLWETLTGQPLFRRPDNAETLEAVLRAPVRPPSEASEDVPPELDDVVMRALSRDTEKRYATARDFGRSLREVARARQEVVGQVELEEWMQALFPDHQDHLDKLVQAARGHSAILRRRSLPSQSLDAATSGTAMPTASGTAIPTASGMMPADAGTRAASRDLPRDASLSIVVDHQVQSWLSGWMKTASALGLGLMLVAAGFWFARASDPGLSASIQPEPSLHAAPRALARTHSAAVPDEAAHDAVHSALAGATGAVAGGAPSQEEQPEASSRRARGARSHRAPAAAARGRHPRAAGRAARNAHRNEHPHRHRPRAAASPQPARAVEAHGAAPAAVEPSTSTEAATAQTAAAAEAPGPTDAPTGVATLTPAETASAAPAPAEAAAPSIERAAPAPRVPPAARTEVAPRRPATTSPSAHPRHYASAPRRPTPPRRPPALAARARVEGVSVSGSMPRSAVSRELSRLRDGFSRCYRQSALRARRDAAGVVRVELQVDERGSARRIRTRGEPLRGVAACVAQTVGRLRTRHPPDTGTVQVRFAIDYDPLPPR